MIPNAEAEEILIKEYHLDNFTYLVKDILLPDFKFAKHNIEFNNTIFEKVSQIGESVACELSVFEVYLKEGVQNKRVTITQEMFKVLRSLRIDNAIVAFVNHDENNFRVSLLTSKYEYDGNKVVRVISNPRRFSYSLGYGMKTKTAFQYLIYKGQVKNLEELTERFSVEVVNKQFYSEIALCYTKLVGGERDGKKFERLLGLHSVIEQKKYAEFAVRLIGRIMFCWFLKEKKSENGIPLIPEKYLTVETISSQDNYYHKILEPLFFELLNTNQKKRKDKYNTDEFKQIPYLNGGLFSPHTDDLYKYDNVIQCGRYGLVKIPNQWFIEFYNVLNQYNFTVDENTSYDIELSIDPEMLGRIFENLLAEINPETGENAKKSTGSFYTPRDIVDYMVDSSLLEYLKNKTNIEEARLKALISYGKEDDSIAVFNLEEKKNIINALYNITILDPACGSGAFPIGMLQKIVYILQEVDPDANLWFDKATENVSILLKKEFEKKFNAGSLDYIRKLSVIQNSIFGIDIQPIAVEISRLRCFLSLVIEENVNDEEDNRGINPLPNLDFKFISANSLISLDDSNQLSLLEDEEQMKRLKEIRDEYFGTNDLDLKKDLISEFKDVQQDMLLKTINTFAKTSSAKYQKLSAWKPFSNESTDWFDPDWMFGIKDGFDIVIGNPPYGILNKKQNQNTSILMPEADVEKIKNMPLYKHCKGRFVNIYTLFIMKAISLLKHDGYNCFIFPLAFMCDLSASNLRKYILDNHQIIFLEAFPERDNEKKRVFEAAKMSVCIMMCSKSKEPNNEFYLRIHHDKFVDELNEKVIISPQIINKIDLNNKTIPLLTSTDVQVMNKILLNSKPLKLLTKCYEGEINITFHKAFIKLDNTYTPLIRGAQVQPFMITNNISQGDILYLDKEKYLENNKADKAYHHRFKRIVMQGITGINEDIRLKMTIIDAGVFCANSVNYLIIDETKIYYILGLLSSKLMNWYYKKISTNSNVNGYEVDNLPIVLDKTKIDEVDDIVKQILDCRNSNNILTNKLNNMVYEIYGLAQEEIDIVEELYAKS